MGVGQPQMSMQVQPQMNVTLDQMNIGFSQPQPQMEVSYGMSIVSTTTTSSFTPQPVMQSPPIQKVQTLWHNKLLQLAKTQTLMTKLKLLPLIPDVNTIQLKELTFTLFWIYSILIMTKLLLFIN